MGLFWNLVFPNVFKIVLSCSHQVLNGCLLLCCRFELVLSGYQNPLMVIRALFSIHNCDSHKIKDTVSAFHNAILTFLKKSNNPTYRYSSILYLLFQKNHKLFFSFFLERF